MARSKGKKGRKISVMDTTLRDGEQTQGVTFTPREKLSIAKALLKEVRVDRIEVANAGVSKGELEAVKAITRWAKKAGLLKRVEVLGFVDNKRSVDWAWKAGCHGINILAKGSLKHCKKQLRKTADGHIADVCRVIANARRRKMRVNVYPEAWSNGMKESQNYVMKFTKAVLDAGAERILLADTLGVLSPGETKEYVGRMVMRFPKAVFEFHAHNDYGLATANSLAAVEAGASGVHVTVNGLGERTGNAALDEVVVAIRDKTPYSTNVNEKKIMNVSKLVEAFSGKRIAENKPVSGESVFTQTAGIHADGDLKAKLYVSRLSPERFGREREYALGKLSGGSSIDMNLRRLGLELKREQRKAVLERITALGDKKERVTPEDLPFIVADVLDSPANKVISIDNCVAVSGKNLTPTASLALTYKGKTFKGNAAGDGGYDAFMNALGKIAGRLKLKLPELSDYEVRIPPGGKTDAIVETTIHWKQNGKCFKTIGVDSDQLMAAIKATEKMLNIVAMTR